MTVISLIQISRSPPEEPYIISDERNSPADLKQPFSRRRTRRNDSALSAPGAKGD